MTRAIGEVLRVCSSRAAAESQRVWAGLDNECDTELRPGAARGTWEIVVAPDPLSDAPLARHVSQSPGEVAATRIEPRPAQGESFTVLTAADMLKRPPPRWIVKGVLPEAELGLIYGPSKAGKSLLAFDLAAAVSRGIDWHGRKVRRGRVVYLCAEGASDFRNRVEAYAKETGAGVDTLPEIVTAAPDLGDERIVDALAGAIMAASDKPVTLLVVDTLSRVLVGAENEDGPNKRLHAGLQRLSSKIGGALALMLGHSGKDAGRGHRGWSGTEGAVDVEINVTRSGDIRTATLTKLKSGGEGPLLDYVVKPVTLGHDADGDPVTAAILERAEADASPGGASVRGKWPTRATAALRTLCHGAAHVPVEQVVDEILRCVPANPDADEKVAAKQVRNNRHRAREAIRDLAEAGRAHLSQNNSHVGLTRVTGGAEFDEVPG